MPIIKSAIKRAKQNTKRRAHNIKTKQTLKQATKAFLTNPSFDKLTVAQSELDKAVKKGLLKKNTASRRKAQLFKVARAQGLKVVSSSAKPAKSTAPIKKATPAKKTPAPVKKATPAKKTAKSA